MHRSLARPIALALLIATPAAAAEPNPVVAAVNGAEIRRGDVEEAYRRLPEQYRGVPLEVLFQPLVASLIDTKLMAQDARRLKIDNEDRFKRDLARLEDQLLERTLLIRRLEEESTEKALRQRYEKFVAEAAKKTEVRARHILVDSEDVANAVIAELQKGGDFAELAKKKSRDPSSASGGDLGFFGEEDMLPDFAKAAFALPLGQFSKTPVNTQFGWHVIKVEERRPAKAPPFEVAEDEIRTQLSRDISTQILEKLRKDAKIERFAADGSPLIEIVKPK